MEIFLISHLKGKKHVEIFLTSCLLAGFLIYQMNAGAAALNSRTFSWYLFLEPEAGALMHFLQPALQDTSQHPRHFMYFLEFILRPYQNYAVQNINAVLTADQKISDNISNNQISIGSIVMIVRKIAILRTVPYAGMRAVAALSKLYGIVPGQ